ncbi:MAG TPA: gamma-glutamyl-gamma-aminobutyrate hydrolase [Bacteroidetes bacterium]|nr:gamma-glutamyl-gamma-aminobutyrate hydrolase [Bacteroidota bacterium]
MSKSTNRIVVVSQRVDALPERNETRDALDQRLCQFLLQCGVLPVPIPTAVVLEQQAESWLATLSPAGIVLSGGNDVGSNRSRDELEQALLQYAIQRNIPLLGICRGMQLIAAAMGGTIVPVEGHVRKHHEVRFVEGDTEQQRSVNSYHSFAVGKLPRAFSALAYSVDGCIEAIRSQDHPIEGWMWHPEREEPFDQADVARARLFLCGE